LRAIQAEIIADSALQQLAIQDEYLQTLNNCCSGESVESMVEAPQEMKPMGRTR